MNYNVHYDNMDAINNGAEPDQEKVEQKTEVKDNTIILSDKLLVNHFGEKSYGAMHRTMFKVIVDQLNNNRLAIIIFVAYVCCIRFKPQQGEEVQYKVEIFVSEIRKYLPKVSIDELGEACNRLYLLHISPSEKVFKYAICDMDCYRGMHVIKLVPNNNMLQYFFPQSNYFRVYWKNICKMKLCDILLFLHLSDKYFAANSQYKMPLETLYLCFGWHMEKPVQSKVMNRKIKESLERVKKHTGAEIEFEHYRRRSSNNDQIKFTWKKQA